MGERGAPQYELELVHLASAIWVNESNATSRVRKHFESLRKPLSRERAKEYVLTMFENLAPNEFVESKRLESDVEGYVLADVYGVRNEAGDWYFKFYSY